MTKDEADHLEALRVAKNEAARVYRAEDTESNRLARNKAAREWQVYRISVDPKYAADRSASAIKSRSKKGKPNS